MNISPADIAFAPAPEMAHIQGPVPQAAPETPPPKRRKIQLACGNCRDRKTRCDGGRPVCSACERRDVGADCVYETASLSSRRFVDLAQSSAVMANRF
jgi:hypothetical protein